MQETHALKRREQALESANEKLKAELVLAVEKETGACIPYRL